ncbi:ribonuclease H-like domain-containing protein [Tanacetum coccineum]
MHYYGAPAMSPVPVSYAPALPYAFHTMTLQNSNWNMDTGASSLLAGNTSILTSFSNSSMSCSVNGLPTVASSSVGDSTGDLYLSTSNLVSTPLFYFHWFHYMHRRLGHPEDDMLRLSRLSLQKIIISRHARFDEEIFPFGNVTSSNKPTYDFLLPPIQTTTNVPTTEPFVQHMDEPNNPITPHPTTPPTSPPQPDTPPSHSSTPIPPQPDTHPSHSSTPIPTSAQTQSPAQTVDSHTPIPINNSSQTMPTHPMVTRAKVGIFKPLERMNCHVTTTSPLPRSHVHALRDPSWKEVMLDEYNALITNGTWVLVPRPPNVNVVHSMWLFKHKFNADGSLSSILPLRAQTYLMMSSYMHDPRDPHFTALKRILRYVCGTLDYGMQLHVSSTTQLSAYTDVTLSRSSAEAEYRGVANVVAETAWIRNLLCELHAPLFTATLVYCDNVSVVYMSANPVQHQRTKHIEIDIHFVRDFVASGQVRVLHVPSRFQFANIFTKGLPTALFIEFRSSLNVRRSPAHTEGEY